MAAFGYGCLQGGLSGMIADSPGDPVRAIREAGSLRDLVTVFDVSSEEAAYFAAKAAWKVAIDPTIERSAGLPGAVVHVKDTPFWIHGVTHAGTDAERTVLRRGVQTFLAADAAVFCEQGIRRLYFQDLDAVREMDDYRWAVAQSRARQGPSHIEQPLDLGAEDIGDTLAEITDQFREATFTVIDAGRSLYGDRFADALGDVASALLTDHADLATRAEYEAFALSRRAARDPSVLASLQAYYHRSFLPQPLEREWLRAHDPELELMTHARNERMAAYALTEYTGTPAVHLIVGAAHQPGIADYLQAAADGRWTPTYDPVEE